MNRNIFLTILVACSFFYKVHSQDVLPKDQLFSGRVSVSNYFSFSSTNDAPSRNFVFYNCHDQELTVVVDANDGWFPQIANFEIGRPDIVNGVNCSFPITIEVSRELDLMSSVLLPKIYTSGTLCIIFGGEISFFTELLIYGKLICNGKLYGHQGTIGTVTLLGNGFFTSEFFVDPVWNLNSIKIIVKDNATLSGRSFGFSTWGSLVVQDQAKIILNIADGNSYPPQILGFLPVSEAQGILDIGGGSLNFDSNPINASNIVRLRMNTTVNSGVVHLVRGIVISEYLIEMKNTTFVVDNNGGGWVVSDLMKLDGVANIAGNFQVSNTGHVLGTGIFNFSSEADIRGPFEAKSATFAGPTHISAFMTVPNIRFTSSKAFILGVETNITYSNLQLEKNTELNLLTGAINFIGSNSAFASIRSTINIGKNDPSTMVSFFNSNILLNSEDAQIVVNSDTVLRLVNSKLNVYRGSILLDDNTTFKQKPADVFSLHNTGNLFLGSNVQISETLINGGRILGKPLVNTNLTFDPTDLFSQKYASFAVTLDHLFQPPMGTCYITRSSLSFNGKGPSREFSGTKFQQNSVFYVYSFHVDGVIQILNYEQGLLPGENFTIVKCLSCTREKMILQPTAVAKGLFAEDPPLKLSIEDNELVVTVLGNEVSSSSLISPLTKLATVILMLYLFVFM